MDYRYVNHVSTVGLQVYVYRSADGLIERLCMYIMTASLWRGRWPRALTHLQGRKRDELNNVPGTEVHDSAQIYISKKLASASMGQHSPPPLHEALSSDLRSVVPLASAVIVLYEQADQHHYPKNTRQIPAGEYQQDYTEMNAALYPN